MLYHFLVPLAKDHIVFNVFRYVTFRSFMALITALVISLMIGPWLIGRLRRMQHGAQTVREDTPDRHRSKKGTPTMGGVVILTAILGSTLLWANLLNRYVWVVMLAVSGFGLIGMWDDWMKIRKLRGLSARVKFLLQALLTLALLQIVFWQPRVDWQPVLAIPFFKGWLVNLGWWWFAFALLVVVGAIGMLAVLTKAELLLPLIGGIYVVEAVSVIVQVASFKLTGRRVFRMAPLHHHYELTGWPEPKIVVRFWIVSFALALLALTTLKLR